jgi:hypothetical protein
MMSEANTETVCFVCVNLDTNTHADRWQNIQLRLSYQRIAKYQALRETASRGCKLCSIILEGVEAFRGVLGRFGTETEVFIRCQPPLLPLEVGIAENKRAAARWLEFFTFAGK